MKTSAGREQTILSAPALFQLRVASRRASAGSAYCVVAGSLLLFLLARIAGRALQKLARGP